MKEEYIDRVPPHNLEAEQAVLGAIFLDNKVIVSVSEILTPEDFYRMAHQKIYHAMLSVHNKNIPVDIVSVVTELSNSNQIEDIGGTPYIRELAAAVPTAANAVFYAEIVEEKAVLRRLIQTATTIVTEGYSSEGDLADLLNNAEKNILAVSKNVKAGSFKNIQDVLVEAHDHIVSMFQSQGDITGIPSGFPDLDRMTAGFQKNDLIIVAARPSVGKTAFALNIAQSVATKTNETVAIFSLEMGAEQLVMRMLCAEGNLDAQRMRTGKLTAEDWGKLSLALGSLANSKVFIDDTPGIKVSDIRNKCRRLAQEHGLGMILIDYLQLIQGSGNSRENRQQEVSEISRTLKEIARELQLSRGVESRQDKRPIMSDIRESGSIEQDADIVAFLYRDDYYEKETEKKNIIEIIIAKQRNGPVGTVELAFRKEYNKFLSIDRNHQDMV